MLNGELEKNLLKGESGGSDSAATFVLSPPVIRLRDLRFYAYHGALPQERSVGGEYSVTLTLTLLDGGDAVRRDDLAATINYAEAYALVQQAMQQPSALLEHVAGRILSALFAAYPARLHRAEVTVEKCNPPLGAACAGAAVTLRATRQQA